MEFEYHLTVHDLELQDQEKFISVCEAEQVKPVMIVLDQGNYIHQPMCTGLIKCENLINVDKEIEKVANKFRDSGFEVIRKKVEISPKEDKYFHELRAKNSKPYFEWHGKIEIVVDDIPKVKNLVKNLGGHISKNSLNKNGRVRFITIRDYESKDRFYKRAEKIKSIVKENKISFLKEAFELCIYDSREELDSGWIS
ncbi:hypothetical protein [Risungbinella massiliensis]|uniref:hypothetical protein n=1 Tax=Risungbinella massiliensis TaxID=1329796 RepID=UPI0005CC4D90|nr:hypothetical protein [Risungbinella massiliensis]